MAATTVNLLGLNEAFSSRDALGDFQNPNEYISAWSVTSGNGTYTITDLETYTLTPTYYAMNVGPTNSDPIVVELENQSVTSAKAFNCNLTFSGNVLSDSDIITKAEISQQTESFGNVVIPNPDTTTGNIYTILVDGYPNLSSFKSTVNLPGQWTSFRSNYYPIVENQSAASNSTFNMKIRLTVSGHEGQPFQITTCALIDDTAFHLNNYVRTGKSFIPTFYWDMDATETNPTYPYYKLLDIMTSKGNEALTRYKQWFDYELTELHPRQTGTERWTRSTLVDPEYVGYGLPVIQKTESEAWLAQFIGTTLKRNVWATGGNENAAGGSPNGNFESWITDEGAYIAWQFENGYYGVHGGTRDAVLKSVQQVLSGDKEVALYPNSTLDSGTAQAGSATTITLAAAASALDDYYNGSQIELTGGTGQNAATVDITDYVGSTKVATVASWAAGTPDATSTYKVTSHWHMLLQTVLSETPDSTTVGDSSAPVMDAVELARPMGYFYTHAVVAALYLTLDNMGIGRLSVNKLG